ncbi:MAG TPA: ATP-binding protein [Kofleriaceae bacterium]|jgi:ATP-dependent 26S proteasome regulatory subunit|nr:ATP-binding protein [Kofleriaceae bacterium]
MSDSPALRRAEAPEPLTPVEHARLELRRVATRLLDELGAADEANPRLVRHLAECRARLPEITGEMAGLDGSGDNLVAYLDARLEATLASGHTTPLHRLQHTAALGEFETDVLLLAALAEDSALWSSLFALLVDNQAGRRPTLHLAMNLACCSRHHDTALAALIEGGLVRHQLVRLLPIDAPLAERMVTLAPETWLALCGIDAVEPQVAAALAPPVASTPPPVLPAELAARAEALAQRFRADEPARVVLFGPTGVGRRTLAHWLASRAGARTVELRVPSNDPGLEWCAAAVRHAVVRGASLVLTASPGPGETVALPLALPERTGCYLVLPERCDVRGEALESAPRLTLPLPGVTEREELWRRAVSLAHAEPLDPGMLARRFRLSGGEIRRSVQAAMRLAELDHRRQLTLDDLACAVAQRPALRLESLARRRIARAQRDDLVLPAAAMEQLDELIERVEQRDRVFEDWGFGARSERQTAVLALFAGPSGTGKTLAAEVIAARLGVDLYCIDLSQMVSKYIGETEKNLSRVFDAAEGTAALLFFDEADGIFGKRTDTKDSHDRYANLEVSYLLARLETFTGAAILASNLRQNIDTAFLRRMDFLVDFPQPDMPSRKLIWQRHLRCDAPLAGDIDLPLLSRAFPVSGAQIRNAVVAAAFRAAAEDGAIGQAHLVAAMRREYEKQGKAFPGTPVPESSPRRQP